MIWKAYFVHLIFIVNFNIIDDIKKLRLANDDLMMIDLNFLDVLLTLF